MTTDMVQVMTEASATGVRGNRQQDTNTGHQDSNTNLDWDKDEDWDKNKVWDKDKDCDKDKDKDKDCMMAIIQLNLLCN